MSVTRRDFLATTGLAAAAPFVLGTTDKSGSKLSIVGDADHQYEAIHDWGQLPAKIKYGNTHGVCEDSQGHIYIHHTVHADSESADTIVIFDETGKFVRSWGKQFKGGAHGLMFRKEGNEEFLYLCDYAHAIVTKRTLKEKKSSRSAIRSSLLLTIPTATTDAYSISLPMLPLRQTVTSTWPMATARATSISTPRTRSSFARLAVTAMARDNWTARTASG